MTKRCAYCPITVDAGVEDVLDVLDKHYRRAHPDHVLAEARARDKIGATR